MSHDDLRVIVDVKKPAPKFVAVAASVRAVYKTWRYVRVLTLQPCLMAGYQICILFHVKPAWKAVKAFMWKPEFLQQVDNLHVDAVAVRCVPRYRDSDKC